MQNDAEILWTSGFLNERFTEPVSPLGWSVVGALFEQLALRDPLRFMGYPDAETIPATRLWRAQPYVNVAVFQIIYKPFPDAFVPADAVRYFPRGDLAFRQGAPYPTSLFQRRFVMSLVTHLLREAWSASPLNYLKWQRFVAYHDAQTRLLAAQLDAAETARELLGIVNALCGLDTRLLRLHRWSLTYAEVSYKILAQWTGERAPALIRNTPNKTREVNEELGALARMSAPLSAALLERINARAALDADERQTADALARFLARHGHRAFSLDLAQPTFSEDPTQLLPLISTAVNRDESENWHDNYLRARRELLWQQRVLFRPLVALTRRYAQLREDQRYYWQKSLALTRRAFLKLGADLAARQALGSAADIFYATNSEIQDFYTAKLNVSDFSARVAARQTEWRAYREEYRARGTSAYPPFLCGDAPLAADAEGVGETHEWRGRGVSPGVARGVARIVFDPRDLGRVAAGEILVAPSTDPAWTPVFARVAGIALERGGVLSHAAVVAREYHVPAVTAAANLTRALSDGEIIEVDGTEGIVRRVQKSSGLLRPAAQ